MAPHRLPRNTDLSALEDKLGHRFQDQSLLELALTHSSATVEPLSDNERMEFLGDAVLALAVNERLFRTMPADGEGELTRIKSAAVSTTTLARVARALGLGDFMRLGKGLGDRGGLPDSVLANVTEAIFAAIYLDGGLEPAKALIIRLLEPEIAVLTTSGGSENAKSQLQELAQRRFGCAPRYRLLHESGPQHNRCFEIAVEIRGRTFPDFSAHTKKEAEQGAARLAIEALTAPRPEPAVRVPAAPAPAAQAAPAHAPAAAGVSEPAPAAERTGRKRRHRGGRGRRKSAAAGAQGAPRTAPAQPKAESPRQKSSGQAQKAAAGRRGRTRKGGAAKGQGPKSQTQTRPQTQAPAAAAPAPVQPAAARPVPRLKRIARNPYDMLGNIPS
ncbi:MAG TPA: ribonuclease III [Planctomycetota bacterium]|nr:ribonuclease III [Planctomycetota bacterium]